MKHCFIVLFLLSIVLTSYSQNRVHQISINGVLPQGDFEFIDISGKNVVIEDIKKENGTLFIFTANYCSSVQKWENRYNAMAMIARDSGIGFALINSNAKQRLKLESLDMMRQHAAEVNYDTYYYLLDKNSSFANALGAQTAPHAFLFSANNKLVYKGVIDDNARNVEKVETHYLKDALLNLVNKKPISPSRTAPKGCSIKRAF